ncbi:hypothetical protein HED54_15580 [Ochrobactrum anthropi ATCC 49188]|nr:hypothetical protein [Brucella anthropi ATCC 49188]
MTQTRFADPMGDEEIKNSIVYDFPSGEGACWLGRGFLPGLRGKSEI